MNVKTPFLVRLVPPMKKVLKRTLLMLLRSLMMKKRENSVPRLISRHYEDKPLRLVILQLKQMRSPPSQPHCSPPTK